MMAGETATPGARVPPPSGWRLVPAPRVPRLRHILSADNRDTYRDVGEPGGPPAPDRLKGPVCPIAARGGQPVSRPGSSRLRGARSVVRISLLALVSTFLGLVGCSGKPDTQNALRTEVDQTLNLVETQMARFDYDAARVELAKAEELVREKANVVNYDLYMPRIENLREQIAEGERDLARREQDGWKVVDGQLLDHAGQARYAEQQKASQAAQAMQAARAAQAAREQEIRQAEEQQRRAEEAARIREAKLAEERAALRGAKFAAFLMVVFVLFCIAVYALIFGGIGYWIGKPKGRGTSGFWFGVCLPWFGWVIVGLLTPTIEAEAERRRRLAELLSAESDADGVLASARM
jgi:hypothetical protein